MNRNYNNYSPNQQRRQSGGGYNQQFNQTKPFLSAGFLDSSASQNQGGNTTSPNTRMNLRSQQKTPEQSPTQQIPPLFAGNNQPVVPVALEGLKTEGQEEDFSQEDAVMAPAEKGSDGSGGGDEKTSRQRILGLSKRKSKSGKKAEDEGREVERKENLEFGRMVLEN